MNILITAGGTAEKIDDVRHITNHSTGGLGKMIAEAFAQDSETTVTYLHGKLALTPNLPNVTLIPITSVDDLLTSLTDLLMTQKFDAVIHSMAVSDYILNAVIDQEAFASEIVQQLLQRKERANLNNPAELTATMTEIITEITQQQRVTEKKISSQSQNLMLSLGAAVKVISKIKALQPETILVGFKLLVAVTKEELQAVAYATLQKNQADFVLANDLTEVGPRDHQAILVDQHNQVTPFTTKSEIAQGIKTAVQGKLKGDAR